MTEERKTEERKAVKVRKVREPEDVAVGDRVRLVRTTDLHTRLTSGDEGTVTRVDDRRLLGDYGELAISVRWDSGSNLTMLPNEGDEICVILVTQQKFEF